MIDDRRNSEAKTQKKNSLLIIKEKVQGQPQKPNLDWKTTIKFFCQNFQKITQIKTTKALSGVDYQKEGPICLKEMFSWQTDVDPALPEN